jgi:hypothetical protein
MITVSGSESDYAIMKQVQQLRIAHPHMTVVTLDSGTDFSPLTAHEKLYLVAHGNAANGNVRDIKRPDLVKWLTDQGRGVPQNFGGIVILSCYSGLEAKPPQPSLSAHLATALTGRTATGTTVAGANGFSFGTPEFQKTGLSSVLLMDLAAFYFANDNDIMITAWLNHRPTHDGGVLKDTLGIDVDTGKTIGEHLDAVQMAGKKTSKEIADECITAFAGETKKIETQLTDIIDTKIPGGSVVERAEYLVTHDTDPSVLDWNAAINRQYSLFSDLYLWASPEDAFTVAKVP